MMTASGMNVWMIAFMQLDEVCVQEAVRHDILLPETLSRQADSCATGERLHVCL
jgi:hypothetical protein